MSKKNQETSGVPQKASTRKWADEVIAVAENPGQGGLEIRFNAEPSPQLQPKLRVHGFRHSRTMTMWYGDKSAEAKEFAEQVKASLPTSPDGPDLFLSPSFDAVKSNIEKKEFSFILITLKDGHLKNFIVFEPSKPRAEVIAMNFAKQEFADQFLALAAKPKTHIREARMLFDEGKIIGANEFVPRQKTIHPESKTPRESPKQVEKIQVREVRLTTKESDSQPLYKEGKAYSAFSGADLFVKGLVGKFSDVYYKVIWQDGESIEGSVDLEPVDFYEGNEEILSSHIQNYFTNLSKIEPSVLYSKKAIEKAKKILEGYELKHVPLYVQPVAKKQPEKFDAFAVLKQFHEWLKKDGKGYEKVEHATKEDFDAWLEEVKPDTSGEDPERVWNHHLAMVKAANKLHNKIHGVPKIQPYSSIYNKLLKIIPNLIEYLKQGKQHGKSVKDTKGGLMDLNYDFLGKDKNGNYLIALAHNFVQNGDVMADPDMQIRIIPDMEAAEALTFQQSSGDVYQEVYSEKDGKQLVNLKLKKDLNAFLSQWLTNIIKQGHTIDLSKAESEEEEQEQQEQPSSSLTTEFNFRATGVSGDIVFNPYIMAKYVMNSDKVILYHQWVGRFGAESLKGNAFSKDERQYLRELFTVNVLNNENNERSYKEIYDQTEEKEYEDKPNAEYTNEVEEKIERERNGWIHTRSEKVRAKEKFKTLGITQPFSAKEAFEKNVPVIDLVQRFDEVSQELREKYEKQITKEIREINTELSKLKASKSKEAGKKKKELKDKLTGLENKLQWGEYLISEEYTTFQDELFDEVVAFAKGLGFDLESEPTSYNVTYLDKDGEVIDTTEIDENNKELARSLYKEFGHDPKQLDRIDIEQLLSDLPDINSFRDSVMEGLLDNRMMENYFKEPVKKMAEEFIRDYFKDKDTSNSDVSDQERHDIVDEGYDGAIQFNPIVMARLMYDDLYLLYMFNGKFQQEVLQGNEFSQEEIDAIRVLYTSNILEDTINEQKYKELFAKTAKKEYKVIPHSRYSSIYLDIIRELLGKKANTLKSNAVTTLAGSRNETKRNEQFALADSIQKQANVHNKELQQSINEGKIPAELIKEANREITLRPMGVKDEKPVIYKPQSTKITTEIAGGIKDIVSQGTLIANIMIPKGVREPFISKNITQRNFKIDKFKDLEKFTDDTLSNATPQQLYELMQLTHPSEHSIDVSRGTLLEVFEQRGEELFKELGLPTDKNYPYVNVYTGYKSVDALYEVLGNKEDDWWAAAENYRAIGDPQKAIEIIDKEMSKLKEESKKMLNDKTGKVKGKNKTIANNLDWEMKQYKQGKDAVLNFLKSKKPVLSEAPRKGLIASLETAYWTKEDEEDESYPAKVIIDGTAFHASTLQERLLEEIKKLPLERQVEIADQVSKEFNTIALNDYTTDNGSTIRDGGLPLKMQVIQEYFFDLFKETYTRKLLPTKTLLGFLVDILIDKQETLVDKPVSTKSKKKNDVQEDPLTNDSGVYTEETAGKNLEHIEIPFPKEAKFRAAIEIAKTSSGEYKFGISAAKLFGDAQGISWAASIDGQSYSTRKEAFTHAFKFIYLRIELLIATQDSIFNNEPQKIKQLEKALTVLKAFGEEQGIEMSENWKFVEEKKKSAASREENKPKKINQLELNKSIEEYIDAKDSKKSAYSAMDKIHISQYTGSGGLIKQGASGKGILYEYYTPDKVIERMWGLAYQYGFTTGRVLEPSVGTGHFLKYAPKDAVIYGFETNHYSARIAQILYPQAQIFELPFETIFFSGNIHLKDDFNKDHPFDLVVGNPPYGEFSGKYAGMGEKKWTGATEYDQYFLTRGLDLLKPGGLLVFIIPSNFFTNDSKYDKLKEKIVAKADLLDAYRLPGRTFDTTDIGTDIVVFKRKNK